jgi:hypothetical protein
MVNREGGVIWLPLIEFHLPKKASVLVRFYLGWRFLPGKVLLRSDQ